MVSPSLKTIAVGEWATLSSMSYIMMATCFVFLAPFIVKKNTGLPGKSFLLDTSNWAKTAEINVLIFNVPFHT